MLPHDGVQLPGERRLLGDGVEVVLQRDLGRPGQRLRLDPLHVVAAPGRLQPARGRLLVPGQAVAQQDRVGLLARLLQRLARIVARAHEVALALAFLVGQPHGGVGRFRGQHLREQPLRVAPVVLALLVVGRPGYGRRRHDIAVDAQLPQLAAHVEPGAARFVCGVVGPGEPLLHPFCYEGRLRAVAEALRPRLPGRQVAALHRNRPRVHVHPEH